jgi:hypothetical protein
MTFLIGGGALVYLWLIVIILAVYAAHLVRRQRLRNRIAKWAKERHSLPDDAFYVALDLPSITKDAANYVRATISHATRIPKDLISPNDNIRELEKIGDPSHSSTVDYFEDMWSIAGPKDNPQLATVRDFVIEFGPKANPFDCR